jgi:Flp pilus assembly protein TadD
MIKPHILVAGAILAVPLPAAAGVTVIGTGNARMCYLAAVSKVQPGLVDMRRCDEALIEERGSPKIMAATHVNRGILRLRRGNYAGATADFDAATRINPDEPEAYLNRASVLLRQAQATGAIEQFDVALAKKTRRPELAYYGRGVAHEEAGNVRAAYRDYMMASQLAPTWREPRAELARFKVVRN